MSDAPTNGLHLPDLSISNFRGIGLLSIRRLGRVTLLGGRNGVGKTSVLDAVRTYAARGNRSALHDLLNTREEFATGLNEDLEPVVTPDYAALFYGRTATREQAATIGPSWGVDDLRLEVSRPGDWSAEQKELFSDLSAEVDVQAVKVLFRNEERLLPWIPAASDSHVWSRRRYPRSLQGSLFEEDKWPVIDCESLGPGLPSNRQLARYWDNVALTEEEDLSLQALRLADDGIERVAVVGDDEAPRYRVMGRRVVVKLRNHARPVPLKSLVLRHS